MYQQIPRVRVHQLSTGQLNNRLSEYKRVLRMLEGYTSQDAGRLRRMLQNVIRDLEREDRKRQKQRPS